MSSTRNTPEPEKGLRCPTCHCDEVPVVRTEKAFRGKRRVRKCAHCGRKFVTIERSR